MKQISALILILVSFNTFAILDSEIEFNKLTAEEYSQNALIEYWKNSNQKQKTNFHNIKPIFLSGYGIKKEKIVLVLYSINNKLTYVVGLYLNKNNKLEVFSNSEIRDSIEGIKSEFKFHPFMPGN